MYYARLSIFLLYRTLEWEFYGSSTDEHVRLCSS